MNIRRENYIDETKKRMYGGLIKVMKMATAFLTISFIIGSYSYFCRRYQALANAHDDLTQMQEMGPLIMVFGVLSIILFVKKKYYWGIITAILSVWAVYFLFKGFSCQSCGMGGIIVYS